MMIWQIRLESDVSLAKDSRERTHCAVSLQCVGPVLIDLRRTRTNNLDERILTPIQIIDILFRQSLTCPFVEFVSFSLFGEFHHLRSDVVCIGVLLYSASLEHHRRWSRRRCILRLPLLGFFFTSFGISFSGDVIASKKIAPPVLQWLN